jgi:hypothetical protein
MSEWWTYRLSSFLMFSPKTYWRNIELFNETFWPAHLLLLAVGGYLLWLAKRQNLAATRWQWMLLAAIWLWVGWAFHSQHYSQINWAAKYFALAFNLQGLLLLGAGVLLQYHRVPVVNPVLNKLGWLLALSGILLYPLIGFLSGRPWTQTELFGMTPEPTALTSLGLILLSAQAGRFRYVLLLIPVLSLMVGAATLWLVA